MKVICLSCKKTIKNKLYNLDTGECLSCFKKRTKLSEEVLLEENLQCSNNCTSTDLYSVDGVVLCIDCIKDLCVPAVTKDISLEGWDDISMIPDKDLY